MADDAPFSDPHDPAQLVGTTPSNPRSGTLLSAVSVVGIIGLVAATVTDSVAVTGRHLGLPLIGSIEIVQAAIVMLACASIVLATAARAHASIHVVTERVGPHVRRRLALVASVVSICAAIALAAGSLMMLADTWSGHERSETLHIPFALLRLLVLVSLLGVALLFARDITRADHDA
jgi:TRAP-type C4-dicarboxylate transport system permease small subunit